MKKLFLFLLTFTCLYAMGQVNEQTSAGFEFPFQLGDAQWKSYSSTKDRIEALQIPEDKLKNITTTDLLNVCLDFPYSMDMLAFDLPEVDVQETAEDLEWTLEVYDTVNNRMMYSDKVIGTEASVSTSGWTPGIYVVRVTLGDNTLSNKIFIK